jgi:formyl-CoA transferase
MNQPETFRENGGPLRGLKVLDLTRVLSGPFATMWMATMGADVLKVENPNDPDITRTYPPFIDGKSAYFPSINHNKKAVTLNLKTEKGKEILLELIKDADVIIENFRPGVMEKLGLGYEKLREVNNQLIYASISGYGTYGPYSERPGYDVTAQAVSGIMALTGQPDDPPTRVGSSIGDTCAGINTVLAILAALYGYAGFFDMTAVIGKL